MSLALQNLLQTSFFYYTHNYDGIEANSIFCDGFLFGRYIRNLTTSILWISNTTKPL